MSKLVQKGVDGSAKQSPVIREAMQVQEVLIKPAPKLFDGIKPRSIGGQTK